MAQSRAQELDLKETPDFLATRSVLGDAGSRYGN